MTDQQTLENTPWYKQFWPWFIIALPLSAVIAGIITVVIAFKHQDSLVVDDYYKSGLAINSRTALQRNAREQDLEATLYRLESNFVHLRFARAQPLQDELNMEWVHPTESDKDFTVIMKRQNDGSYQVKAPENTHGRWYLRLYAPDRWLLKTEIPVETDQATFKPLVP